MLTKTKKYSSTELNKQRYWNPTIELIPRRELERLQEERLLRQVKYAYYFAPLIRKVMDEDNVRPEQIRNIGDFQEKVPFVSKDVVRKYRKETGDVFGGIGAVSIENIRYPGSILAGSGTTGEITSFPVTWRDVQNLGEQSARFLWEGGLRPGMVYHHVYFGWHTAFWLIYVAEKIGVTPVYTEHYPLEARRFVTQTKYIKPDVVDFISPPLKAAIDEEIKKQGLDSFELMHHHQVIGYGGEALTPKVAKSLTEEWGVEYIERTSINDITAHPAGCREHTGFHISEDMFFIEVIDPLTSEVLPLGKRGELCFTPLITEGVAPLRWRTDDIGIINEELCPCGRAFRTFKIIGRKGDEVRVKGVSIMPLDIMLILQSIPETETGLAQTYKGAFEMDILKVRVGYNPTKVKDTKELQSKLEEKFKKEFAVPLELDLVPEGKIAEEALKAGLGHKIPRIIQVESKK